MNTIAAVNSRYAAYAMAHRKTPEAMMQADEAAWPGGCMTGFILWIDDQRRRFIALHPEKANGSDIRNYEAWDDFLNAMATESRA